MKKILRFLILSFIVSCSVSAKNLVFNSDGRLDTSGFTLVRTLRPDTNPNLIFTQLRSENKALVIDNPFAERFELHSREFTLKPNIEYKISFECQSSGDPEQIRVYLYTNRWSGKVVNFTSTQEWKKYEFHYRTDTKADYYHLCFLNLNDPPDFSQQSFRNICVENIETSEESSIVEVSAIAGKKLYNLEAGKKCEIEIMAAAPFETQGNFSFKVIDDYTGKCVYDQTVPATIGPEKTFKSHFSFPLSCYGAFRIEVDSQDFKVDCLPGYFAVIGKYNPEPLDFSKDFCVGVNGGLFLHGFPDSKYVHGYKFAEQSPDEFLSELSRMGCRIIRDHDSGHEAFSWLYAEPQRGVFDYSWLDRALMLYERHGLTLLPVLGRSHFRRPQRPRLDPYNWPVWLRPLCDTAPIVTQHPMLAGSIMEFPPVNLWKNFVTHMVRHASGRIPFYQIHNEPMLYMHGDRYFSYLKSASEAIHETDPGAKVVGLCLTTDFNANIGPFHRSVTELGGYRYLSVVAFHPYEHRTLNSTRPADTYIQGVKETVHGYPLWNTECYFLFDKRSIDLKPHHATARFLLDLGEGVRQSIAPYVKSLYKNLLEQHPYFSTIAGGARATHPSGVFVAYNALSRLFESAEPVMKHKKGDSAVIYAYRRKGQPIAALWNYKPEEQITANLSDFKLLDIFGNPINSGTYELTEAPFYLQPGNDMTETEFLDALKQVYFNFKKPLLVHPHIRQFRSKSGSQLAIIVENRNQEPLLFTLEAAGGSQSVSLAGEEKRCVIMPLKKALNNTKVTLNIKCNEQNISHSCKLHTSREFHSNTWWNLKRDGCPLQGVWRISSNEDKIRLEILVKDSTDSGEAQERERWNQDCVELFFDPDPLNFSGKSGELYSPETIRMFINPRLKEKQIEIVPEERLVLQDVDYKISNTSEGYEVILELPRKIIATNKMLGLDIKLDDAATPEKERTSVTASGNWKTYRNRLQFNLVNFKMHSSACL